MELAPFKTLIKDRCGLSFSAQVESKLTRAITLRMRDCGITCAADYAARLARDLDEFQHLVNLLTINETYFFREPETLRWLCDRLLPRLLSQAGDRPVRILSAGCSSGEEPYSLAILLWERYGEKISERFELLGGDIDSAVLERARAGHYSEFSFRGVAAALRDRYFTPQEDGGYLLQEFIRRQVRFHAFNLLAPTGLPPLCDCDLILYRNVSIYFDTPTRERIQRNLAKLLRPRGIVVLGAAETLANDLGVLALFEEDGVFYFAAEPDEWGGSAQPPAYTPPSSRTQRTRERGPLCPAESAPAPSDTARPPAATPPADLPDCTAPLPSDERLLTWISEHQFAAASAGLAARLAHDPADATALLLDGYVALEQQRFAEAAARAHRVLEREPWSLDALLLAGLAAKWQGDHVAAARAFKQAIYTQPDCWPAHYYLGEAQRALGETDAAQRAWHTVARLLSADLAAPTGLHVLPLSLPRRQMLFLCQHRLASTAEQRARF